MTPFFISHRVALEIGEPDPQKYNETCHVFYGVFSTKRLMRNIVNMEVLHVD